MIRSPLVFAALLVSPLAFAAVDSDGDGWDATADCDDQDALVHPAATELCNGVDDDCDSVIDPMKETWYADRDADGYGVANDTRRLCPGDPLPTINQGTWASRAGDCFDTNANMSPGLAEVCDGLDNNCDGTVNNNIPVQDWHPDLDSDGHGSDLVDDTVTAACPPAMHVLTDDDCDDDAPRVHPGAAETCDQVDEDCNGDVDDGLPTQTWYPDADKDGYGDDDAAVDACGRPPRAILDGGDCDDASADVSPEADERCNDRDDNCDGSVDEEGAIDASTFFADWDDDGFANPNITLLACALPADGGWLPDSLDTPVDCNDSNARFGADCTRGAAAPAGCNTRGATTGSLLAALTVLAATRRRNRRRVA